MGTAEAANGRVPACNHAGHVANRRRWSLRQHSPNRRGDRPTVAQRCHGEDGSIAGTRARRLRPAYAWGRKGELRNSGAGGTFCRTTPILVPARSDARAGGTFRAPVVFAPASLAIAAEFPAQRSAITQPAADLFAGYTRSSDCSDRTLHPFAATGAGSGAIEVDKQSCRHFRPDSAYWKHVPGSSGSSVERTFRRGEGQYKPASGNAAGQLSR